MITIEQARAVFGTHLLFPVFERVIVATNGLIQEAVIGLSHIEVEHICGFCDELGVNPASYITACLGSIFVQAGRDPMKVFWESTGFAVRMTLGIHGSLEIYGPFQGDPIRDLSV